jgi:hypothetical protein
MDEGSMIIYLIVSHPPSLLIHNMLVLLFSTFQLTFRSKAGRANNFHDSDFGV